MPTIDALGNHHKATGTPDAGRFTEKPHSAPTSVLEDCEESSNLEADAITFVRKRARQVARNYNFNRQTEEDIAQDSILHALEAQRRSGLSGGLATDHALLRRYVDALATRYTPAHLTGLRHEDMGARRALKVEAAQFRTDHGRDPNGRELDEMAERIRLSMPPGRRPKPDFHKLRHLVSFDAPASSNDDGQVATLGELTPATDQLPFTDSEDSAAGALHEIENGGANKAEVKADIWRVIGVSRGAPAVAQGKHTASEIKEVKSLAADLPGGIAEAAEAYIEGRATYPQRAALFAPFGHLTDTQRIQAAEVFSEHAKHAESIWGSALKQSGPAPKISAPADSVAGV